MVVSRFALLAGGQRREHGPEECIRDLVCQGLKKHKHKIEKKNRMLFAQVLELTKYKVEYDLNLSAEVKTRKQKV